MIRRSSFALLICLSGTAALAQPSSPPAGPLPEDAVGSKLYPPDLIMSHQGELGLQENQRAGIIKEMEAAQAKMIEAQWNMQEATGQLVKLLSESKVDEVKALAQADKLMVIEREVKRTQLGMLIRIRNFLSDAQRAKLDQLRAHPSGP